MTTNDAAQNTSIAMPVTRYLLSHAFEGVKELTIGWISVVRPSRHPLRGFLRTRTFLKAMTHLMLRSARRARLEARSNADAAPAHALAQGCRPWGKRATHLGWEKS